MGSWVKKVLACGLVILLRFLALAICLPCLISLMQRMTRRALHQVLVVQIHTALAIFSLENKKGGDVGADSEGLDKIELRS